MESISSTPQFGIHYFHDKEHYRLQDAINFLPLIKSAGSQLLFLTVQSTTAIPEYFLSECIKESLCPVIHLQVPVENASQNKDLYLLVETYAKQGIKHLIFFDRPNMRSSWSAPVWVLPNLVERFVDQVFPLFVFANRFDILPILPPLEPGGDYWDTLFLKSTLQAIQRRNYEVRFGISAYGWTCGHPLDWGKGGPERWPLALPYHLNPENEDHRGIHIHEWYSSIARSVGFENLPMFVLEAGKPESPLATLETWQGLEILNAFFTTKDHENQPSSSQSVQAMGLWMPGEPDSTLFQQAVEQIKAWQDVNQPKQMIQNANPPGKPIIEHYVLVGTSHPAITDWRVRASHPFVVKHKATLGFSLQEASQARHVTILATEEEVPEADLSQLRHMGIFVERISETGTALATILRER